MGQSANNNSCIHKLFEAFKTNLFEIIFKSNIFTTKIFEERIIKNTLSINALSPIDQDILFESLDEVSAIYGSFEKIKSKYLYNATTNVSINNFKEYVKSYESGYYYLKAFILYFIRLLLLIEQIIITIRFYYPKYICTEEPFDERDKKFWVWHDQKLNVIELETSRELSLRSLIFTADAMFIICEFFVLKNLQRIKMSLFYVILAQLTKFICILIIIVPDFSRKYCENSLDDENLFYASDNTLEKIMDLYEILNYLIS